MPLRFQPPRTASTNRFVIGAEFPSAAKRKIVVAGEYPLLSWEIAVVDVVSRTIVKECI